MLETLVIQDFLLIDRLTLALAPGVNVFTGETGAGKSILLDALGLALGGRAEIGLLRKGAKSASVAAHFSAPFPPAINALFDEQGLEAEETLILRRTLSADGKSRAFLNDLPVSVALLRRAGEALLEVHGQFETHGLLDPNTHRGLLDAFGAFDTSEIANTFRSWHEAEAALTEAKEQSDRAKAEEDYLRASVAELEDLAPRDGEIDSLAAARTQLQSREKIMDALQTTERALNGEKGAASSLSVAGKALARIADKAPGIDAILALIDQASAQIDEAEAEIARKVQDLDDRTETLESIEERLFALRAVARKHAVEAALLPELAATLKQRLALIEDRGATLKKLGEKAAATRAAFFKKAEALSTARAKAAQELERKIAKELAPLKLEKARFAIELSRLPENQANASGLDRVTFLVATNPGSDPGPLHKIASGGELARFMLALKVVLTDASPVPTLVFDEVDTGISGATASAVGERLARLGETLQVLVVTHSPQVAARGETHFLVAKDAQANQTTTKVSILAESERIEEIGRLLAGATTTKAALEAAKSLLSDGKAPSKTKKSASVPAKTARKKA